MKWAKSVDFSEVGIGWFLKEKTSVEFCVMLMTGLNLFLGPNILQKSRYLGDKKYLRYPRAVENTTKNSCKSPVSLRPKGLLSQ